MTFTIYLDLRSFWKQEVEPSSNHTGYFSSQVIINPAVMIPSTTLFTSLAVCSCASALPSSDNCHSNPPLQSDAHCFAPRRLSIPSITRSMKTIMMNNEQTAASSVIQDKTDAFCEHIMLPTREKRGKQDGDFPLGLPLLHSCKHPTL